MVDKISVKSQSRELLDKLKIYYRRNPRRSRTVIIALVVFVILSYGAIHFTSTPGFCSNCHEIYPAYDSWSRSVHADIACDNCHEPPGITGAIARAYLQFTKYYGPDHDSAIYVKNEYSTATCRQCHSSNRTMSFEGGLTVPHEKHLAMGYTCVTCHSNIVHGPGGESSRRPRMETCMRCHDGKTAPEGCGVCHLKIPNPTVEYYIPY